MRNNNVHANIYYGGYEKYYKGKIINFMVKLGNIIEIKKLHFFFCQTIYQNNVLL